MTPTEGVQCGRAMHAPTEGVQCGRAMHALRIKWDNTQLLRIEITIQKRKEKLNKYGYYTVYTHSVE